MALTDPIIGGVILVLIVLCINLAVLLVRTAIIGRAWRDAAIHCHRMSCPVRRRRSSRHSASILIALAVSPPPAPAPPPQPYVPVWPAMRHGYPGVIRTNVLVPWVPGYRP